MLRPFRRSRQATRSLRSAARRCAADRRGPARQLLDLDAHPPPLALNSTR